MDVNAEVRERGTVPKCGGKEYPLVYAVAKVGWRAVEPAGQHP